MSSAKTGRQKVKGHEKCPCGSNQTYRNCCKKKDIVWYTENGQLFKEEVIEAEIANELETMRILFKNLYGRDPSENDHIFWGIFNDESNFDIEIIRAMREVGVKEEYIYAYTKTGLLPSDKNINKMPDGYIEEFNTFVNKYREYMSESVSNEVNVLQYVQFANGFLLDKYNGLMTALEYSFNYFIKVHLEGKQDFLNYIVTSKLDYGGLCAIKTLKNLESIKQLKDYDLEENILATSRFIFESYLYMARLNSDNNFFENYILNSSKRIYISNLAGKSKYKCDKELYDLFFRVSSKYVHLDVLTAQSYFKVSNPFEEVDGSLVASIMGITFAVLTLEQIVMFPECQKLFQKDLIYMIIKAKQDLIACYRVISSDSLLNDEVYSALIFRLEENG
ncbi:SEC-C domain-containing protein [Paenibacillus puerhi]|uniref:SEC-C domain-containing protein n=1 Tax=Paenibacillus puerhi TaxID=2692622 RepID=UPI00135AEB32|nr:SEC-C domain-containing protein [Paenibacillus puerhi]